VPPTLENTLEIACRDRAGRTTGTEWFLQKQQNIISPKYLQLVQALADMSNAAPYGVIQSLAGSYNYQPSKDIFNSVLDECILAVRGSLGPGYVAFPAPKSSLFLPNSKVLNMSDPRVVRFIQAASGILGDANGEPWQLWVGGFQRTIRAVYR
jgi:hypothetical protein